MGWRGLLSLVGCLPAVAFGGIVDVLGAEIARDVGAQLKRQKQAVNACVYVDDSLSPGLASAPLATSIGASLANQFGVRDVLDVGLATLSEAPSVGALAGCDVVVVVAFDAPSKNARSRVLILQTTKPSPFFSPFAGGVRTIGEPFSSSIVSLPVNKTPIDPTKGWKMQQISMGNEPILSLVIGSITQNGAPSPAVFALTKNLALAYRFDARPSGSSLFPKPKELYRADLAALSKATKPSRDATGTMLFEPSAGFLLVRTSSIGSSYRLWLDERFSSPQPASSDETLNQLWPLAIQDEKLLFGLLEDGTNLFTKKLWWIDLADLDKTNINRSEVSLAARFYAASMLRQDKGKRLALLEESEELNLYQGQPMTLVGSLGKAGAQLLLFDLEQDQSIEILTTGSDPFGEGDMINLSALDGKSPRKLWSTGTLKPPASIDKTKLSWVTALATGDIDGDGSIEMIAALQSVAGSSILIISK